MVLVTVATRSSGSVGAKVLGHQGSCIGQKSFEVDAAPLVTSTSTSAVAAMVVAIVVGVRGPLGINQGHDRGEDFPQIAFVLRPMTGQVVGMAEVVAQDKPELDALPHVLGCLRNAAGAVALVLEGLVGELVQAEGLVEFLCCTTTCGCLAGVWASGCGGAALLVHRLEMTHHGQVEDGYEGEGHNLFGANVVMVAALVNGKTWHLNQSLIEKVTVLGVFGTTSR